MDEVSFTGKAVATIVGWVLSLATVYWKLSGRVQMTESRLDTIDKKLSEGSAQFNALSETQREHGERLARVETLVQSIDDKLDLIVTMIQKK